MKLLGGGLQHPKDCEVLAVCSQWSAHRSNESGTESESGPGIGPWSVATAGDFGVWVWDTRSAGEGPAIKIGGRQEEGPAKSATIAPDALAGDAAVSTAAEDMVAGSKGDCCTAVCFHPKEEYTVIAADEKALRWYDLRAPHVAMTQVSVGDDEINQISVNDRGSHLAAADDSGAIRIFDARTGKVYKTLRRWGHENICTTVQFRPGRPWELLSGGMDTNVIHWDASKGKPFQTLSMASPGDTAEQGGQMCNPPLVHSLAVSGDGTLAAVGLADLTVSVLDLRRRGAVGEIARLRDGHRHGVSQVHFPAFDPCNKIVSGGNDRQLCIWSVPKSDTESDGPIATATNAEKINWIASQCSQILVVDTSRVVKMYDVQ